MSVNWRRGQTIVEGIMAIFRLQTRRDEDTAYVSRAASSIWPRKSEVPNVALTTFCVHMAGKIIPSSSYAYRARCVLPRDKLPASPPQHDLVSGDKNQGFTGSRASPPPQDRVSSSDMGEFCVNPAVIVWPKLLPRSIVRVLRVIIQPLWIVMR